MVLTCFAQVIQPGNNSIQNAMQVNAETSVVHTHVPLHHGKHEYRKIYFFIGKAGLNMTDHRELILPHVICILIKGNLDVVLKYN